MYVHVVNGQNPRGQNLGRQNPRKIWPLGQKNPSLFSGGWTEPQAFKHLLFMDIVLFKIVKSVGITFFTFMFHGMLLIVVFFIEGNSLSSLK